MNCKYKISWCPTCNQGWVTIVKEIETQKLFLYCWECETEWNKPQDVKDINIGTHDQYGRIEEPSYEDIQKKNWEGFIIQE